VKTFGGASPCALAGVGGAIGLAAAVAGARLIRTLLFGVTPTDPAVFGFTLIVIIGVASPRRLSGVPGQRARSDDHPAYGMRSSYLSLMASLAADPAKPKVPFRADK